MSNTPQERGREYEREFAASIGGEPVKNSGAGFDKLDVLQKISRSLQILWSCKSARQHKSFRVEEAHFQEADIAINGPGGIGGPTIPALAVETESGEFVVFRRRDLEALGLVNADTYDRGGNPLRSKSIEELLR